MKNTLALALVLLALSVFSGAQICPGSHLNYYVRDAQGRLIDADANGLIYEEPVVDPKLFSHWGLQGPGTFHGGFDLPSDLATFDKTRNKSLVIGGMCGFRRATDLKLTLNGKVMELHFALPDMGDGPARRNMAAEIERLAAGQNPV